MSQSTGNSVLEIALNRTIPRSTNVIHGPSSISSRMAGLRDAAGPCLLVWDGNLLGSSYSKFGFKIFALKWVNCFLLTTLKLPAEDGQLNLHLTFPGKKLVIRHHVAVSWGARLGPVEERARLGLRDQSWLLAEERVRNALASPFLQPPVP